MHTQASENVGYVYVAGYDATPDHVKIGMTERSPEERVEEWGRQTGSPGKPFIYYAAQVSNPRQVESMIHRRLRDRKISGGGNEWFQGPDECIQAVREIAVDETVSILNRKKAEIIAQLERVEGSDEYRALQRRRAIEEEERQARLEAEERERQARLNREEWERQERLDAQERNRLIPRIRRFVHGVLVFVFWTMLLWTAVLVWLNS